MKLKDALAADYWIEHTDRIYKEQLHVSSPVMEAYLAGFEEAKRLALQAVWNSDCDPTGYTANEVTNIGEEEV